jgi:hypothetical protein
MTMRGDRGGVKPLEPLDAGEPERYLFFPPAESPLQLGC